MGRVREGRKKGIYSVAFLAFQPSFKAFVERVQFLSTVRVNEVVR